MIGKIYYINYWSIITKPKNAKWKKSPHRRGVTPKAVRIIHLSVPPTEGLWPQQARMGLASEHTYPKGAEQGTWKATSDTYPKGAEQGTWKATSDTYPKGAEQATWKATSDTYPLPIKNPQRENIRSL